MNEPASPATSNEGDELLTSMWMEKTRPLIIALNWKQFKHGKLPPSRLDKQC